MEESTKEVKRSAEIKRNAEIKRSAEIKRNAEIKRGPNEKTKNLVGTREIIRDGKPGSGKYKGPDKIAVKKQLTEKQKAFVDEYLQSHNATAAYRAAKGTLGTREDWIDSDRPNGMAMKNLDKVKSYLLEKIATDAELCLDYQMEMIQNEDIPAAVRMDGIKDRLNRLGVGKQKEENQGFSGIGEVTITIKHKQPTVVEGETVEILDDNNDNDGETN